MSLSIDRDYVTQTLIDLVQINSINPSLVTGGAGEAEIAAYIARSLDDAGLVVTPYEPEPGRVSVVGVRQGEGDGRSLMLNAHVDTVGVEGMADPFSGSVQDNKVYGRGAYDMKGSLAACMAAAKALVDANVPLGGDVMVAAVADEEYASLGMIDLLTHFQVDGAIVTEPTEMDICLAHKGFIWLDVEVTGRAAHGSRFDLGVDANMRMGRFLAALDQLEQELRSREGHPLVGPPSLHAALLEGGSALSAYAAKSNLKIERRTIPGETEAQVVAEIQALIDKLSESDSTFSATVDAFFVRNAFEVSPEATIVRMLQAGSEAVLGKAPNIVGQTPWMDSAFLSAAGVETVVMGPIGAGAHADEEWVDIDSVVDLALILAQTAISYCK
ncbi:MAG: ArgE/DapE family deacylase [Chloroflexota bacterium]